MEWNFGWKWKLIAAIERTMSIYNLRQNPSNSAPGVLRVSHYNTCILQTPKACALTVRYHGLSNTHWNSKQASFSWHWPHCLRQLSTPAPIQCCTVKIPSSLLIASTCLSNFFLWLGDCTYVTDEIKNSFHYKSLCCCSLFSVYAVGWINLLYPKSLVWSSLAHCPAPYICTDPCWDSVPGHLQIRGPSYRLWFLSTARRH